MLTHGVAIGVIARAARDDGRLRARAAGDAARSVRHLPRACVGRARAQGAHRIGGEGFVCQRTNQGEQKTKKTIEKAKIFSGGNAECPARRVCSLSLSQAARYGLPLTIRVAVRLISRVAGNGDLDRRPAAGLAGAAGARAPGHHPGTVAGPEAILEDAHGFG